MSEKPAKDSKDGKAEGASSDAAAKPAGSKKKMLIIVIVLITLLLGGGGAAAWFMLRKKPEAHAQGQEPAKVEPKKLPVFVDLESFTVNLQRDNADDADRYMQIKLVAEVKDAPAGEVIKSLMPSVRSEVILLLGSKRPAEVESREGKEALVKEIILAANKPLARTTAENGVEGVNITHLIVQ